MTRDWSEYFHQIADRWVDDVYAPKAEQIPLSVYHYTDAQGLEGMLRTGKIWLTDYSFLNDQSEIKHTRDIASYVVEARANKARNDVLRKLYHEISDYQASEYKCRVCVFSLSQRRDDLSQWRGYAREGMGFTIGLDAHEIAMASKSSGRFSFFKIDYSKIRQDNSIKSFLIMIEREVARLTKLYPEEMNLILDGASSEFAWAVEQRAAANKHKSFRVESEWRIAAYLNEDAHPLVRCSGSRLINYIEISILDTGKLPIKSIGVGPGFTGAEQAYAVRSLCGRYDYEPEIYSADTPYRRLI